MLAKERDRSIRDIIPSLSSIPTKGKNIGTKSSVKCSLILFSKLYTLRLCISRFLLSLYSKLYYRKEIGKKKQGVFILNSANYGTINTLALQTH